MNKTSSRKCFYKNGKKILKRKANNHPVKESIETIGLVEISSVNSISSLVTQKDKVKISSKIRNLPNKIYSEKIKSKIHLKNMRVGVTNMWASISVVAIFVFLISVMITPQKARPEDTKRYAVYSSRPLTLQPSTNTINSSDSRAQRINGVFKIYNCPLEGLGDVIVYEADKNDIPWWLVAAVSFQESGCGKKTPKPGGAESYNAWGWGVYGGYVFSFDNWVRGIETVSKYFGDKFFSKGIADTCEIMKTYTPPSQGSWCEGVDHFGDIITNYESP